MQDRKRFEWLSSYFAGLSAAQKLAAGTLVVVMLATAMWLGGRTRGGGFLAGVGGRAAMEPILDQSFADADLRGITDRLNYRSVPNEVRDGKVYVPADRKLDALSDLYYAAVLTGAGASTESGFDALIKQMSAFDPPSKTDKLFNRAREQTCERVIARFRGVRKTTVVIDPTSERHISGSVLPSAMVDVQTLGESNARQLATAAINVLTGCVAQLSRDRVKVTVDGATYNSGGGVEEMVGTDELIAHKQQCEQMYVGKVRKLLGYIPDVMVSVSVDLDVQSMEEERHIVDPDKYVNRQARSETATRDAVAASATPAAGDVGTLFANAVPALAEGIEAASNAASNAGGKSQENRAEFSGKTSETVQKSRTPAGRETVRSASVVVPRSYFVGIYRRANRKPQLQDPDDALLQPVVDAHLVKIRGLVKNALGLESDDDVTVEPYDDVAAMAVMPAPAAVALPAVAAATAVPAPAAALLNAYSPQIAMTSLGLVTGMSLLLLLRRRPIAASVAAAAGMPTAEGGSVLSGTLESPASPEVPVLPAGASAEEAEAHRMFHRVRDVVGENPEEAARVLRGWIYQGQ